MTASVFSTPISGGGGAWVKISSATASTSATIDFTGLSSAYIMYRVEIQGVIPDTSAVNMYVRVGTGATPTYSSSTIYTYTSYGYSVGSGQILDVGSGLAQSWMSYNGTGLRLGAATGGVYNASMWIFNPSQSAKYQYWAWQCSYLPSDGTSFMNVNGGGTWNSATAVTALRFFTSSGNILSGTFTLYGLTG